MLKFCSHVDQDNWFWISTEAGAEQGSPRAVRNAWIHFAGNYKLRADRAAVWHVEQ